MQTSIELLKYRSNVYSHNGEDGVLGTILQRLPKANKWAVEFGAWDGKWASNTSHLLETQGWNVLYIECDKKKFAELKANHGHRKEAHLVCEFIDFQGPNTLDEIFKRTPGFPVDPDLVSMDIDGCEYHLWQSLNEYKPKVIITEYNATIPLDHEYIQPKDFSVHHSSSIKAFIELAKKKGYTLISILDYNGIFVRNDVLPYLGFSPATPEELIQPFVEKYQTRLWQSQDGRIHIIGCDRLLWHNVAINPDKIQVLPKFLQINPAGTGVLLKILRLIYYKVPFVPQLFNFIISGKFGVPK